eukprot:1176570-Pyramimonas_sp.AAC.1
MILRRGPTRSFRCPRFQRQKVLPRGGASSRVYGSGACLAIRPAHADFLLDALSEHDYMGAIGMILVVCASLSGRKLQTTPKSSSLSSSELLKMGMQIPPSQTFLYQTNVQSQAVKAMCVWCGSCGLRGGHVGSGQSQAVKPSKQCEMWPGKWPIASRQRNVRRLCQWEVACGVGCVAGRSHYQLPASDPSAGAAGGHRATAHTLM